MSTDVNEVKDLEGKPAKVFPSVRYGDSKGRWDPDAPRRVAAFVLGFDPETRATALNERIWDVIQPIDEFWYPEREIADLEITDKISGRKWALRLGDHVGRTESGMLRIFSHNDIVSEAFPGGKVVPQPPVEAALAKLIKDYHLEEKSKTQPDLVAQHLLLSLNAFDETMAARRRALG